MSGTLRVNMLFDEDFRKDVIEMVKGTVRDYLKNGSDVRETLAASIDKVISAPDFYANLMNTLTQKVMAHLEPTWGSGSSKLFDRISESVFARVDKKFEEKMKALIEDPTRNFNIAQAIDRWATNLVHAKDVFRPMIRDLVREEMKAAFR